MIYSKLQVKQMNRKKKYGDGKIISEETGAKPSAISQVLDGVYYNQQILDAMKRIIDEREAVK
jgi:hypothetical protein